MSNCERRRKHLRNNYLQFTKGNALVRETNSYKYKKTENNECHNQKDANLGTRERLLG